MAWCPHLNKDINIIENVKRQDTRMITELRHLPYKERLQSLGLMSMVKRRLSGDMLEVFKILNGIDNVVREHFFAYSISTLRGHNMKLFKPRCRLDLDIRKFTFSNHATDA